MQKDALRVAIILGTAQEGRSGSAVANWFIGQARLFDYFTIDVINLAEVELPLVPPRPAESAGVDVLADTAARLTAADAFVAITPEYNHSFPASLKNLIDWHRTPWQAKPVAFVSYGGLAGGLRAVEQLRVVFAELHAVTIRDTVSFHAVWDQLDEDGNLRSSDAVVPAKVLLERLVWWATALKNARTQHPYVA